MLGSAYVFGYLTSSFRQMSMPKPVCPNMATVTPIASAGPGRRRSSTPGGLRLARSHPPPESISSPGRRTERLPRCGELTFRTPRGVGPEPGPGRTLIPGDGAAGDQRAQNKPVPVSTASWRYGLRRTPACDRQVTSTSIHMAEPGPASTPPRSRTAIDGHIVFGSNHFRSTLSLTVAVSIFCAQRADHPFSCLFDSCC